ANCEHDVSLASAAGVADALWQTGYEVVRLTIDQHGTWLDGGGRPVGLTGAACLIRRCDALFPVVHGPRGEDGTLAALADLAGIPLVGSGVRAGALAMDKWVTKLVAGAVGVATAPGLLITEPSYRWTHPVVVKPASAGSSHGVSLVAEESALDRALAAAFTVDSRVLVEDVVVGREIDLAVLGRPDGSRVVAPALEVLVDGLFDYDAKYVRPPQFVIPAPLDDVELKQLEDAAIAVYDALGCSGLARVDFFLTLDGPFLNEVNTMPGFTEHSQVPQMFSALGTTYPELVDLLVRDTLLLAGVRVA
ncbi:MAG: D-alanine--D-alanine ligase family protein, partial [Nocardioides sp.]